jgi:UDP-N-acetylglucosamine--N-acetylmuramyl-(pentapeptide) pyrophosphoryl-undecaprenol N-acetylglucosamine transferase
MAAGGSSGPHVPRPGARRDAARRGWRVRLSTMRGAPATLGASRRPSRAEAPLLGHALRGSGRGEAAVAVRVGAGRGGPTGWARPPAAWWASAATLDPACGRRFLRVPRMIHEQNGVLGRVNRSSRPARGPWPAGTWPRTCPRGSRGAPSGNHGARRVLVAGRRPPTSAGGRSMEVLVIGGLPRRAPHLSDRVPRARALPMAVRARLRVSQPGARGGPVARVSASTGPEATRRVRPSSDDVRRRMAQAQLVIAGPGRLGHRDLSGDRAARAGPECPMRAAADHQRRTPGASSGAGAARWCQEARARPRRWPRGHRGYPGDPARLGHVAGALALGKPDAAERLAGTGRGLARGKRMKD